MPNAKRRIPWKVVAIAFAAVVAIAVTALLPVANWSEVIVARIDRMSLGEGMLLFAAIYFVATLLFIPAWIFPIASGSLFGFFWGFALALATAMGSALTAFVLARHLLREPVRSLAGRFKTFKACEKAMAVDGWKMVALMRLSPLLPFSMKNYLFGTTKVTLVNFAIGTFVGLLPGMLFKVYLGWAGRYALGSDGPMKWALVALGLAATAGASWLVARRAKARLALA